MSIRFAASRPPRHLLGRRAAARAICRPANDNSCDTASDEALHAALRYFAQHGLAAAGQAHGHAEAAALRGDAADFARWRNICHALDRRLARQLDRKHANAV